MPPLLLLVLCLKEEEKRVCFFACFFLVLTLTLGHLHLHRPQLPSSRQQTAFLPSGTGLASSFMFYLYFLCLIGSRCMHYTPLLSDVLSMLLLFFSVFFFWGGGGFLLCSHQHRLVLKPLPFFKFS